VTAPNGQILWWKKLHSSGSIQVILHFLLHFKNVFKPQLLPIVKPKIPGEPHPAPSIVGWGAEAIAANH
jgi:hypothetical protein